METRAFERLAAFAAETLSPNNPQTRVVPDSEMWQTLADSEGRAVATVSRPYRMGETGQGAGLFRLSAIDGQPVAYFPRNPRHCDVAKAIRAFVRAEARGRAIVAEELARAFALRIKPAERPALGRAARALAELDSLGLDLLNPDWRDVLESGFGFGPAARSAEVLA